MCNLKASLLSLISRGNGFLLNKEVGEGGSGLERGRLFSTFLDSRVRGSRVGSRSRRQ